MTESSYKAACACNNVKYYFNTAVPPELWPVRTCTCSFCSHRTSHVYSSDPNGSVRFECLNTEEVTRFRHGTRTADFLVCVGCDSHMGAVMLTEKGRFAVLNVEHLVEGIQLSKVNSLDWEHENLEVRLVRRHKTWTPVIETGYPWASDK